jgi:hypothetical protein
MTTFAFSGLFFLKFYRRTRQRFFLHFAITCSLLAAERIPLIFIDAGLEVNSPVYLFRLAAFAILLKAIWDTNKRRPPTVPC